MKKIVLYIVFIVGSVSLVNAQSEKYVAAMQKNLELLDSSTSVESYQNLEASFERIANAEKTQWLPFYYAGLCEVLYGFTDPNADKDAVGNRALELAAKADAIQKSDETKAIYYMAYIIQLMVDPMARYTIYGPNANAQLAEGLKINPNNPRLYFLKGQGLLNTPEFAGGGKEVARPILEKAIALFETEKTQPLYPNWGKKRAQEALDKCK